MACVRFSIEGAPIVKTDYEIPATGKRCSISGRELAVGEKFYAVLTDDAGKIVRTDYSASAWQGPPPGAFAHWTARVPASETTKKPTFNEDVLYDCFRQMSNAEGNERINFRYVLALFLLRRKWLKFEDARRFDNGQHSMILRDARNGDRYEVADPQLSEADITAAQDDVFRMLGW
jgi:hypothetical protein